MEGFIVGFFKYFQIIYIKCYILFLHGRIALNNLRGKWDMMQSLYNKLTRYPIYP